MHVCPQVWTCWWAQRMVWSCWTAVVRARFTPSSTPAGSNRWTSWRASTCSSLYQVVTATLRQSALTTVGWGCPCFWHKTTVFNGMPNTRCQIMLMRSDLFIFSFHWIAFRHTRAHKCRALRYWQNIMLPYFWSPWSEHQAKLLLKLRLVVIDKLMYQYVF